MIELNGENYLTGNEACRLLGVKVSTLYTYVSRGVLRSYRQGIKRQSLYKQAELEALLQLRCLEINGDWETFIAWSDTQYRRRLVEYEVVQVRCSEPLVCDFALAG